MLARGCLWCWVSVPGSDSPFISLSYFSAYPHHCLPISPLSPSFSLPLRASLAHLSVRIYPSLTCSPPGQHHTPLGSPGVRSGEYQEVLPGPRARRDGSADEGTAALTASPPPPPQVALLETNPYLLALTIIVSIVHSVFEFLAFKNGKGGTLGPVRGRGGLGTRGCVVGG